MLANGKIFQVKKPKKPNLKTQPQLYESQNIEIIVYDGGDEDIPASLSKEVIYDGGGEDDKSN
jgi:hypothetical protein